MKYFPIKTSATLHMSNETPQRRSCADVCQKHIDTIGRPQFHIFIETDGHIETPISLMHATDKWKRKLTTIRICLSGEDPTEKQMIELFRILGSLYIPITKVYNGGKLNIRKMFLERFNDEPVNRKWIRQTYLTFCPKHIKKEIRETCKNNIFIRTLPPEYHDE